MGFTDWKRFRNSIFHPFAKPPTADLTCMVVRDSDDESSDVSSESDKSLQPPPRSTSRMSTQLSTRLSTVISESTQLFESQDKLSKPSEDPVSKSLPNIPNPPLALTVYSNPIWAPSQTHTLNKSHDKMGSDGPKLSLSSESVARFPQFHPAAKPGSVSEFHLSHTNILPGLKAYNNAATSTVLRHMMLDRSKRRQRSSSESEDDGAKSKKQRIKTLPSRIWRSMSRRKKPYSAPVATRKSPSIPSSPLHRKTPSLESEPEDVEWSRNEDTLYSRVATIARGYDFDENTVGSLIMILGEDSSTSVD